MTDNSTSKEVREITIQLDDRKDYIQELMLCLGARATPDEVTLFDARYCFAVRGSLDAIENLVKNLGDNDRECAMVEVKKVFKQGKEK